jgi:hypothetical protein
MSKPNSDGGNPWGLSDKLRRVLAHPLTLLIVGALLSSLLIPSWTKQWQDRQSELQVKIDLIDQIDNSVTDMIMSVQFAVVGSESQLQADYDRAYRQWEIDRRLIGSKLQAYYPEEPLAKDWDQVPKGITDLYVRSCTHPRCAKQGGYSQTEFLKRKNALFEQANELKREILNTPISVFH